MYQAEWKDVKKRCGSKQIQKIFKRSEGNLEMARDEARHGKALKGLLERYFAAEIAKEKVKDAAEKAGTAVEKAADKVGNVVSGVVEKIKSM